MQPFAGGDIDEVVWSALNPATLQFVPVRGLRREHTKWGLAVASPQGDYLRIVAGSSIYETVYRRK